MTKLASAVAADTSSDAMLDIALHYAAQGWPVFPCRAAEDYDPHTGEVLLEKAPLISNGFKGATLNERIIRELWKRNPGALVGVPTGERSGFWVLDVDVPPAHEDGRPWLVEHQRRYGAIATRQAETGNGGIHYLFAHRHGIRNLDVASGVETRGEGGYFIAPGSVMEDGRAYRWLNEEPIADPPQWLVDLLTKPKYEPVQRAYSRVQQGTTAAEIEDLLAHVSPDCRYQDWVSVLMAVHSALGADGIEIADRWSSGSRKYRPGEVARKWRGFAASGGVNLGTLAELARQGGADLADISRRHKAQPPDDNTRLVDVKRMIANGLRKADAASEPEPANDDTPSHAETPPAADTPAEPDVLRATPFKWIDPRSLPRREFAFGSHYIRKYVSVTVAPGGLGKTANSIVDALSMTSGRGLAGTKPQERLRVWLFNAEDPRDELERRIMAAALQYKLAPADVDGLFLDTGREQELVVAIDDKRSGVRIQQPIVEAVVEQIRTNRIDVMIVDPFVSTHRVSENDNGAIDAVAKLWAQIADDTNCAIDIVHHLRKVADREATVEDARGAVSLIGAARSVRVLNRMSEAQATEASVPQHERFGFFSITYGKSNLTPLSNKLDWRRLESVPLGNGRGLTKPQDFAPVVTEWKWPSAEEVAGAVTPEQLRHIQTLVDNSDYKPAANAKNWAGQAVAYALGLDIDDASEKRRAGAVLKALMKEGALVEARERDALTRKEAVFVRSSVHAAAA